MRIALAQINTIIGDLEGNRTKILSFAEHAAQQNADLVVFPELCVTGYPPKDLLEYPFFIKAVDKILDDIAQKAPANVGIVLGAPIFNDTRYGKRLFNAAILLENGERIATVRKMLLPTYDVFDENRYFEAAESQEVVVWRKIRWGLHICEDMWNNEEEVPFHLYNKNPIDALAAQNVDIFLNISASPYARGKMVTRTRLIRENCLEHQVPFISVNQVGANTELVFDGTSQVQNEKGELVLLAKSFEEDLCIWDTEVTTQPIVEPVEDPIASLHDALVLGIRDYYHKTGFFKKALIGLSGGIDSAVTCALAVEALGAANVVGVTMPSKYSSIGSITDSESLAKNTGIEFHTISIEPSVNGFLHMLHPLFKDVPEDVTEENLQARARGVTLMALSNKFGYLLLTTGNKSEMAVGYATLYGDMSGGLAVLIDVLKMQVYELANYINNCAGQEIIPQNTIDKAPSAELRPNQTDQDSLPPYPVLDTILKLYIEEWLELDEIVEKTGYPRDIVANMLWKVDSNEYKRKQAAPGLKVTSKAFGIGRRFPIVHRWRRQFAHDLMKPPIK